MLVLPTECPNVMYFRYFPLVYFLVGVFFAGCKNKSEFATYQLIVDFDKVSKKYPDSPSYALKELPPKLNLGHRSDLQWESGHMLVYGEQVSNMTLRGNEGQYFRFWIKREEDGPVIVSFDVMNLIVDVKGSKDEKLIVKDASGNTLYFGNSIKLKCGSGIYYIEVDSR